MSSRNCNHPLHPNGTNRREPAVPAEAVQQELERILTSDLFRSSAQQRRFLSFVVQNAIEGKSEEIKEQVLGVEVFGRNGSYDPRIDPLVRVAAGRLRVRLAKYYKTEGPHDDVVIDIPKGTYVPEFHLREQASAGLEEPAADARNPAPPQPFWGLSARSWATLTCAVLVVLITATWIAVRRFHQPTPPSSIAILPFLNLSAAPENNYISDGLSEELTTSLAQLKGLRVVARTSAFQFRGKSEDVRSIGKQLNVGAVLEGSVQKDGDTLRVTAQLINTNDGYHLWSGVYHGGSDELYAMQEEIVRQTARRLDIVMPPGQEQIFASRRKVLPEAQDLYLQGRYFFSRRNVKAMQKSIELFEKATAKDPDFAAAYAGLGASYAIMAANGQIPPEVGISRATAAVQRTLQLDPGLAEAHSSLALVKGLQYDIAGGEQELKQALDLNPSYAAAHHWMATFFTMEGRFGDAEAELRKAQSLDPLAPMISYSIAENYFYWRRYREAIAEAQYVIQEDPNNQASHELVGKSYLMEGLTQQASTQFTHAANISASDMNRLFDSSLSRFAAGQTAAALASAGSPEQLSQHIYVSPYTIASLYAVLGQKEVSFRWLDRAWQEHDPDLRSAKVDPAFDGLRSDPRYTQILKHVGLQ